MLIDLPTELLLEIEAWLSIRDVNALAQTCSLLYRVYDDCLYRSEAVACWALHWAANNSLAQTARKAIAACPGVTGHCGQCESLQPSYTASDPNRTTLPCGKALFLAAEYGSDDVVELLLQMPSVDVNRPGFNDLPPIFCATHGKVSTLKLFLDSDRVDANILADNGWRTPIYDAVHGSPSLVRLLLGYDKVDPDLPCNGGKTPLMICASNGWADMTELLLRSGRVDPNRKDDNGRTPLALASNDPAYGTIKLLLEADGVDPNLQDYPGGWTPLNLAITSNWNWSVHAAIELLVNHEAVDLKARSDGLTPLMWAALYGHRIQTEQLLSSGRADPNATGPEGLTALHIAVGGEFPKAAIHDSLAAGVCPAVVEGFLLYDAVDCNIRCDGGLTPLAVAARSGNAVVVAVLLQSGRVADLNARCGDSGRTPLWWAAERNHGAVVDALLSHGGVDINCKDDSGKTPLDIAREKRYKKVTRVLRRYMYRDRHVYPLPARPWAFEDVEAEGEGVLDGLFSDMA